MSISTKRGDSGETDLMFGKRVPKTHPRVRTCGAVDELNAQLGVVRASDVSDALEQCIDKIQSHLVGLMGVVATDSDDHQKYADKGYQGIALCDVEWLDGIVHEVETVQGHRFRGWSRPGSQGALAGAALDVARTVSRRAELMSWEIDDAELSVARQFLNRLSDVLWLLARSREAGDAS
ncbi:ATP:cob(I)alamin adenosyltransferase [Rubritalea marina]|uniref:ATP:cob(I)alamin adenosyltransferase n=1 Tax=Rubritalea marina TaxID=361055 RepID=UPI000477D9EB|nr:ATP:cob(I)alamin adenosyltransferase [Rubritalea marina]